jgi:two-component system, chemotaxis family, chemotaxis protein CheY
VPKSILIVDDSETLRQVVSMVLSSAGFEVSEASDGRAAISKLGEKKFNLVISDVNMPGMDGIGFLRVLKNHPSYKYTPVIMLTTETDKTKQQQGKDAGAKAWLIKPFRPDSLMKAVSMFLQP